MENWSGIRESNSRLHLGKVAYYHYTNPAYDATKTSLKAFIARPRVSDKSEPVRIAAQADSLDTGGNTAQIFTEDSRLG